MKKLMTMIAAAAMAFGLYADPLDAGFKAGTAFEANDGGNSYVNGQLSDAFWALPADGKGTATVVEGTHDRGLGGDRPANFITVANANNMKVATTLGNPVLHYAVSGGQMGLPIAVDGSYDGLYFDSLVKFTLFDPEDAPDAENAKIAVYPQLASDADGAKAYLTILAKDNGVTNRYVTAQEIAADTWYRLTIKAIADVDGEGQTGFMVFVNGAAVTSGAAEIASGLLPKYADWGARGKIFLSMGNDATIKSVGFDGQGTVDEIAFTTTAPDWAVDPAMYKADWNAIKAGIDKVYVDGVEVTDATELAAGFAWRTLPTGGKATIEWDGKGNYMDGSKELAVSDNDEFTLEAGDLKEAKALFAGEKFAELTGDDGAIAAANAATADGTLKLLAAAGAIEINNANTVGEDPVVITIDLNGQTVTQGESDAAAITLTAGALKIIDSEGDGVVAGNDQATEKIAILSDLAVEIAGGTFNGAIGVYGGLTISSLDPEVEVASNESAPEATFVGDADGKAFVKNAVETYWIVGDPVAETYAVTWDDSEANATAVAKVHGIDIESGDEFETGTEVAFTVTPDTGYEYASAPTGWTLEEDGSITQTFTVEEEDLVVTIPAATAKTYAVTWDDSAANAEAVAKVHGLSVESGTKFTSGTEVAFTVTPDTDYEYASAPTGWTLEEDGTITKTVTVADAAINVEIPAATKKTSYPPDIPESRKEAYDTWAATVDPTDLAKATDEQKKDAFLLDCEPTDDAINGEKAKFVITSITQDADGEWVILTVDTEDGGTYKNGIVNVKAYEDVACTKPNVNGNFFKATLDYE